MKSKYQISNPCSKYKLKAKGDGLNFHCDGCNKNVKNLLSLNMPQLLKTIDKEVDTCVKISSNQLKFLNTFRKMSKTAVVASMVSLLSTGCSDKIYQGYSNEQSKISINRKKSNLLKNQVRGKIMDMTNESIPFAWITIENTEVETYSDFDGNFLLSLPDTIEDSDIVNFKYLGYNNIEIEVRKVRGKEIVVFLGESYELIGYIEVVK